MGGRTAALSAGCTAFLAAGVLAGCGASGSAQSQTAAPRGPKVLHIVFPEGFTRAEMARRIPTVMLFTSSHDGVSHSPLEDTPVEHLEMAVQALARLTARTVAWVGDEL